MAPLESKSLLRDRQKSVLKVTAIKPSGILCHYHCHATSDQYCTLPSPHVSGKQKTFGCCQQAVPSVPPTVSREEAMVEAPSQPTPPSDPPNASGKGEEKGVDPAVASIHATINSMYRSACPEKANCTKTRTEAETSRISDSAVSLVFFDLKFKIYTCKGGLHAIQKQMASLHAQASSVNEEDCNCSPGGLLSEEEQQRAARICICLLNYLHTWAPQLPGSPPDPARFSDPASHSQAVLQLLARLTKQPPVAQIVSFSSPSCHPFSNLLLHNCCMAAHLCIFPWSFGNHDLQILLLV